MSSKGRSGRSSVRPPGPEEGVLSEPQDIAPPADNGAPPDDAGEAMPPPAPVPAPRGPVSVGRSLEITTTPDVCMETLVDKLKLLNYETEFCKKKKPYRKALSRQYFVFEAPNKSEQFFYFTSLTAWLLSLAGVEAPTPKEFDDHNVTCTNLLNAVRKLGFAPPSYAPLKLTMGNGKEVCGVLDGLVDYVLEKRGFTYKRPMYQPEGGEEAAVDDEAEAAAMEGSDELARPEPLQDEDDDEEAFVEASAPTGGAGSASKAAAGAEGREGESKAKSSGADGSTKAPLISAVDPIAWRVELERVAPRLRITVAADSKDWRSHLDEAHQHQETITKAWPDSKVSLEKLRLDLNASLEKLMTREKILNEQFDHLMNQYRGARQGLSSIQDTYNKKTEGVADRNAELHRIAENLEEIKANMDEKGSNITDATPVVRIKTAIKKLNEELHDMEVRIGVVSHSLLQLSLRNKRDMHAAAMLEDDEDD